MRAALLSAVTMLLACGEPQAASPPAGTPAGPSVAAREGRVLFARYCTLCHGAAGQGDGVNAPNLDPRPRDHSRPTPGRDEAQLFAAIRDGRGPRQRPTHMPPFGRTLRPYQIWDLVAHLRELGRGQPPSNREPGRQQ